MTYFTKRYHPPGTVPGTLTVDESAEYGPARVELIDYNGEELLEQAGLSGSECEAFLSGPNVTWIHVQGRVFPDVLRELGENLGLHPLALEDISNVGQRPKAEFYDDQAFVILSMPVLRDNALSMEQVSLFLGKNYVVSFAGGEHNPFSPIHDRLKIRKGRIRSRKADYLLYALVDLIVDQGFPVLETFGNMIETAEEAVLDAPEKATLNRIHALKRELLLLRRMLWPHLELLNQLMHSEESFVEDKTGVFLRDCYDHAIHIIDLIETYRETLSSLQDLYLSNLSNRMNEVMRVLTVIATIFIPLTFVVGVYGMNFNTESSPWNMPELEWHYGYPLVMGFMLAIAIALLMLFRRKKWI